MVKFQVNIRFFMRAPASTGELRRDRTRAAIRLNVRHPPWFMGDSWLAAAERFTQSRMVGGAQHG
jgi:hypothetical protein